MDVEEAEVAVGEAAEVVVVAEGKLHHYSDISSRHLFFFTYLSRFSYFLEEEV